MNTCMKTLLAAACVLTVSCSGDSDDKGNEATPALPAAPAPTPDPSDQPAPAAPLASGFRFVDDAELDLPIYVRGQMNGWLGENVSEELLAASRLVFDEVSGCYVGTLALEAGEQPFRIATYLPEADNTGWFHLKAGLGQPNTSTVIELGAETKADVYYFPAGDANGKDFGGGGNFAVNFPTKGDYEFKFCAQQDDYLQSYLTVSAK
jgi:hypothetical protein